MGKKKDISPQIIAIVRTLLEEKHYTQQQIATRLRISQQTVSNIKKTELASVVYQQQRSGNCGRKRKCTPRAQRKLKNMVISNRKATSKQLSVQLEGYGVQVSPRTVRRELCFVGLPARRPRPKPKITPVMALKRLNWGKSLQNWTVDDWKKVFTHILTHFCK